MLKLQDVFKLSGIPTHTFVKPQEYLRLSVALDTPGRGVIIEGPSGIGKTTSVIKSLAELGMEKKATILSARRPSDISRIKQISRTNNFGLVIIDDFHRLDQSTKEAYANQMKILADEESTTSKIVLIGINKTGQPLLTIARDLRNRIELIKFESNPEEKVAELLELGERALDIKLCIKTDISEKSEGSFHIAQMLAHRACILDNFSIQQPSTTSINTSFETVKGAILDEISLSFYELAKLFCTGQRVKKGSRAPYLHVLHWLSQESEWSVNIRDAISRHPNHKQSVTQIIDRGHLRGHLTSCRELDEIVYYDDISTVLSVEDPKFYYYIKNISWSNFARNIGFPGIEFKFKYDFALSFAGAQRALAEELFKQLSANEITVFYDHNEQHRILAESVESYLAPIYGSESRFVVALLSPEYPQRIWCKFESDQFKGRFGSNSVIPVWYPENFPGFFDITSGIGGLSVDRNLPISEQARRITESLVNKIAETREEDQKPITP